MSAALADTQAIVWYLSHPARLSAAADQALTAAELSGGIFLSSLSIVEVVYLAEKGKLAPGVLTDLLSVIKDPTRPVDVLPVSLAIAEETVQIPRSIVADFPDRIIAAIALVHHLPLVSSDAKIRTVPVITTIW
jgi:PIN domain nuclease of toxin-antitoxin system